MVSDHKMIAMQYMLLQLVTAAMIRNKHRYIFAKIFTFEVQKFRFARIVHKSSTTIIISLRVQISIA